MLNSDVKVLKIINEENGLSQRNIAKSLDISLGTVNSIIKRFNKENYIEVLNKSYKITHKGLNFLESNLNDVKNIRLTMNRDAYGGIKQGVILGAGHKEDFEKPVGLLEIGEVIIIKRTIDILMNNGIEEIFIITGYKNNLYEKHLKRYKNVTCINNKDYKWTGTMSSLSLTKDYIKGDFILVEDDIIFESKVIESLIKSKDRNSIVLTKESGSGDEAFVEIRDEYLFKMSKDVHQFNKIDGEMIGISKISYDLFKMMLLEFKNNLNPYINYEYTMLDASRNYKIGYKKINDLIWGEVDNRHHLKNIEEHIIPMIKRKELKSKINEVKDLIVNNLNVSRDEIKEVYSVGGMTNKNYKVLVNDEYYIVRIPGNGTSSMIDRKSEIINNRLAYEIGIDSQVFFFNRETGAKISKYIEGAETLNSATAKRKENMKLIAHVLKTLHESNCNMENKFDVFYEIEKYEGLVIKYNGKLFKDYYKVKEEVLGLKSILNDNGVIIAPCHNDTVPENFIKDIHGKMYLIDWEYSGLNDPMWDLAAHFLECNFSEDDEELFINLYFNDKVQNRDKIRILIYKICQDFLWSIWTIVKESQGDDFGNYGINRYNRSKENLVLLKEKLRHEINKEKDFQNL